MQLSILDQSTIVSGRSPDASIRESLTLARHVEALGYARYWVAEHHNTAAIAGSAPEVLMAAVAATTSRIRIGSAGIMLPHYSALKVAEQFRVLEAIAPGRIDLGLGRAPGSDGLTAHALNPNAAQAAEHFPAQVRDLMAWLDGEKLIERHPFRDVVAQPRGPGSPEVWLLGSSDYGGQVAAHFGLPFCFAYFISDGPGASEAMGLYRELYKPSVRHPKPYASVCVWALAAETEAEADRLFMSRGLSRLWRDRGVFAPLPSVEEAMEYPYSDGERARLARLREKAFCGTPDKVANQLRALAAELRVDEIAVLTTAHDPAARRHSYTLLAREFALGVPAQPLAAE
jgi:luciferase family oxidoreductase group 1